jgi:hypothetical protein
MPNPNCYWRYISGWPTNDGGALMEDPRLEWKIIPELECEEIRIGAFPRTIAEVRPDMFLDIAEIVAIWEEKHIAVARIHMRGTTKTIVRKSKKALENVRAENGELKREDIYSQRNFLSSSTGIYTRDTFDWCVRKMKNGIFSPGNSIIHGRAVRVTGSGF